MFKKNFNKFFCCLCSLVLVVPNASAFRFFSKSDKKETTLEEAKFAYDKSLESFEESKVEAHKLFDDISLSLSEIENARNDYKFCLEKSNEQMKKLNDAYSVWAALGYPIQGDEYEAYVLAKEEFEKIFLVYESKKEILRSHFEKLECLFKHDTEISSKYVTSLASSINFYYNYGIAIAKNGVKQN